MSLKARQPPRPGLLLAVTLALVLTQSTESARTLITSRHRNNHQPATSGTGGELSTEYFLVPSIAGGSGSGSSIASVVSVPGNRTTGVGNGGGNGGGAGGGQYLLHRPQAQPGPLDDELQAQPPQPPSPPRSRLQLQPLLRQQPWALPLAALSAAAMLLMAAFEIFVLLKARAAAPSRRHLFLGQALLLGLFLQAGLSAAAALTANPVTCTAFRLIGLPAALVFAALLVKCVFLLSLNSGVYLPAPYQALVLTFAVLVQVAIVGQWLYGEPPALLQPHQSSTQLQLLQRIAPSERTASQHHHAANGSCRTPLSQTLASLGYPGALLMATTCLAIRARGVRDNYRESAFIGLAVGLALPIWATSAIGSLVAPEVEREAWLAYGLLATSVLTFLALFVPKGRQLAALGREGANHAVTCTLRHASAAHAAAAAAAHAAADRDDRLSSLPGSGYSPSFFHFKPPPEPSLKAKMHYHSADRVALVSSGIPGCNACRHGGSPVYSDGTSASYFEHMPYIHGPMETFVLPPGMYLRPEDTGNLYTTLSANPNVFFQRAHPGMMY